MDKFLDFLQGFNIQTILSLAAMMWYFTHNIKAEMRFLEAKFEAKMDKQMERTDRLYEMFVSLQKETKDMIIEILKKKK